MSEGLGKLAGIAKSAMKVTAGAIAGAGAALVGLAGKAVQVGTSFESSMSQVAATMGITAKEIAEGSKDYKILAQAAKDAGATTKYSAKEAADALNYLALAGYDAKTSADVLPSVLNLAAASGMDLAAASGAVKKLWGCTKINLGSYGDSNPHLHFHIVPKYEGGFEFGGSFAITNPDPVFLKDEEYKEMIAALQKELGI